MAPILSKVWNFHDFYFLKSKLLAQFITLQTQWLFFCLFKFSTSTKNLRVLNLENLSTLREKNPQLFGKLLRLVCYLMQPIIILDGISLCKVVQTFSTKSRRCTRLDQIVDINCNIINAFPFGPRKHNIIFRA